MNHLNLNKTILIAGITALAFLSVFLLWWQGRGVVIGISNEQEYENSKISSLTGLECDNYDKRPIAVMMASDPITRPLSGISQADIVIEMPVTPNGITRMMAIFQCEEPKEIGSIRSAREDFLTFVKNFKAIYAHWGGERDALAKLDGGILDNVDAMKYEGAVFYRKSSVPRPHNGFTTLDLVREKAEKLGYNLDDTFQSYIRNEERAERSLNNIVSEILINYEKPYDVKWIHNDSTNTYKRTRGGEAEIDANTEKQVESGVVIVIKTTSKVLSRDYISVNTVGEGDAEFYQNGVKASGKWKNLADDLRFYDTGGQEMKFVSGKIWIEIITE